MHKQISFFAAALLVVGFAFVHVPAVQAAGLTDTQIQAILSLLQSFGADQVTINNANAAMHGQSISESLQSRCVDLSKNFSIGSSDGQNGVGVTDVSNLQTFLGISPTTGYFGKKTQATLRSWQSNHELQPTGIADTPTRAALACISAIGPMADVSNAQKIDNTFWSVGPLVYYTSMPGSVYPNPGPHTAVVPNADATSFAPLGRPLTKTLVKGEYGASVSSKTTAQYYRDANSVYLYCSTSGTAGTFNDVENLQGADPATFTPINFYYAKDSSHAWYIQCEGYQQTNWGMIAGADSQTFTSPPDVYGQFDDLAASDKNTSYYFPDLENATANFPWYVNRFAVSPENDGIYFGILSADRTGTVKNVKLTSETADPATFNYIADDELGTTSDAILYKDKYHVYQVLICGTLQNNSESFDVLQNVDPLTFTFDGGRTDYSYAQDKNTVFIGRWGPGCSYTFSPISAADPATFTITTNLQAGATTDATDKNHKYLRGVIVQ